MLSTLFDSLPYHWLHWVAENYPPLFDTPNTSHLGSVVHKVIYSL
jgi:hypothetical protein